VSDAQRAYFNPEVAMTGVGAFMDVIVVSSDYGYRKPDPRLFYRALETLRVHPALAVYVGDNVGRDIWGAKNAGMGAILISRNGQRESYEGDCRPDKIFKNLNETAGWLLS
jgi:putative hydrolase of the HAD superfamily